MNYFNLISLLISTVSLFLVVLCVRKLEKIHRKEKNLELRFLKALDDNFQQVESLSAIYRDLEFTKSLPATRGFAASPDFLRLIGDEIPAVRPQVIVECSSGVSTLVAAKALSRIGGGHVYSLESDEKYCEITRENIKAHGLEDWATIIYAPLVEKLIDQTTYRWYSLQHLPDVEIDLLVIDGPYAGVNKLARYPAGPMLFNRMSDNGIVLIDDCNRADESLMIKLWQSEFNLPQPENLKCEKGAVRIKLGAKTA